MLELFTTGVCGVADFIKMWQLDVLQQCWSSSRRVCYDADAIKMWQLDVLCCQNGICCWHGVHMYCFSSSSILSCLICVVWILIFQHQPAEYFLNGCLPAFAATFKCQQFPPLLMSVNFRSYVVCVRGSQPMGCGSMGGHGIVARGL
jgi:hypothetical protein